MMFHKEKEHGYASIFRTISQFAFRPLLYWLEHCCFILAHLDARWRSLLWRPFARAGFRLPAHYSSPRAKGKPRSLIG